MTIAEIQQEILRMKKELGKMKDLFNSEQLYIPKVSSRK